MTTPEIKPDRITKPIQLLAVWLAGLVILVGAFLSAAKQIEQPPWLGPTLGIAAICFVPLFLILIFFLQTRFRPQLQEDSYYSRYLELEFRSRGQIELTQEVEDRANIEKEAASINNIINALREELMTHDANDQTNRVENRIAALQSDYARMLQLITHSLRTSFHAVLVAAERLRREASRKTIERNAIITVTEDMQAAALSGSRMLDTIRFQTPYDLKATISRRLLEIGRDVLRPVISSLQSQARAIRVNMDLVETADDDRVMGDATLLQTAFYNIVQNAIKYANNDSTVTIETQRTLNGVQVLVTSDGVPVREHELPHIFEPGVRGSEAMLRTPVGMGIGLTASLQIIKLHGGTIEIKSSPPSITQVRIMISSQEHKYA